MFKIGDKVKINYNNLDECKTDNKDLLTYIKNNIDKEYKIRKILELDHFECLCPYFLDDEFLIRVSFGEHELIMVSNV